MSSKTNWGNGDDERLKGFFDVKKETFTNTETSTSKTVNVEEAKRELEESTRSQLGKMWTGEPNNTSQPQQTQNTQYQPQQQAQYTPPPQQGQNGYQPQPQYAPQQQDPQPHNVVAGEYIPTQRHNTHTDNSHPHHGPSRSTLDSAGFNNENLTMHNPDKHDVLFGNILGKDFANRPIKDSETGSVVIAHNEYLPRAINVPFAANRAKELTQRLFTKRKDFGLEKVDTKRSKEAKNIRTLVREGKKDEDLGKIIEADLASPIKDSSVLFDWTGINSPYEYDKLGGLSSFSFSWRVRNHSLLPITSHHISGAMVTNPVLVPFDLFIGVPRSEQPTRAGFWIDIDISIAPNNDLHQLLSRETDNEIDKVIYDELKKYYLASLWMDATGQSVIRDRFSINVTELIGDVTAFSSRFLSTTFTKTVVDITSTKSDFSTQHAAMMSKYSSMFNTDAINPTCYFVVDSEGDLPPIYTMIAGRVERVPVNNNLPEAEDGLYFVSSNTKINAQRKIEDCIKILKSEILEDESCLERIGCSINRDYLLNCNNEFVELKKENKKLKETTEKLEKDITDLKEKFKEEKKELIEKHKKEQAIMEERYNELLKDYNTMKEKDNIRKAAEAERAKTESATKAKEKVYNDVKFAECKSESEYGKIKIAALVVTTVATLFGIFKFGKK